MNTIDKIRLIRAHTATISTDLVRVRKALDTLCGDYPHYRQALIGFSSGIEALTDLATALDVPTSSMTPTGVHGDLEHGELISAANK